MIHIAKVYFRNKWKVWKDDPAAGRFKAEMDAEEYTTPEDVLQAVRKWLDPTDSQTDDPFPTYTNGDRQRDKEQDEEITKIFSKILKP